MFAATIILTALATGQSAPAVDASSIYGMRTYLTNAEFGFMPDKIALAFPPSKTDDLTMHVLKGSSEVTGGSLYYTDTPYPAFKVLRFVTMPVVNLGEEGDYAIEFRNGGTPVSKFPFSIKKKTSGDEFNQTVTWDFITPVDKMGTLNYSNSDVSNVWLSAWMAPVRDNIPLRSMATVKLTAGGKVIAHHVKYMLQEPYPKRYTFKLTKPEGQGNTPFTKVDLLKVTGDVVGTIEVGGRRIRTFTWNVSGGQIKPHARSASTHEPRTSYLLPRRLAGSEAGYQFFHLEEQYWADSK